MSILVLLMGKNIVRLILPKRNYWMKNKGKGATFFAAPICMSCSLIYFIVAIIDLCQRRLRDEGRFVAVVLFAVGAGITNSQPLAVSFPMGRVVEYSFSDNAVHVSLTQLLRTAYLVPLLL